VSRCLTWAGEARFELTHTTLRLGTLSARGTMLFGGAEPYRVDYQLDTGAGFVTKRLTVHAAGLGWARTLRLARDAEGSWNVRRTAETPRRPGRADRFPRCCRMPPTPRSRCPRSPRAMPVLRHGMHQSLGGRSSWRRGCRCPN